MQYTIAELWQAIYAFIPSFKKVREAGVYMNLPSCLNDAIIEWSALRYKCEKSNYLPNQLFVNAADVLHAAYDDLQTKSQFMPIDNS